MNTILKLILLINLTIIYINLNAQTCGTCVNANYAAGCNNGITTCTTGNINCTFVGGAPPGAAQDFPDIGNNPNFDTPIYCTDITTPTSIGGSTSFGLGGISLLATEGGPGGAPPQCGFNIAEITLFDAACNAIPPLGGPDELGLWDTWAENQICCNAQYTICFQYVGVSCPNGATVTEINPELYYIEEGENANNIPVIDFAAAAVCDGAAINFTTGGACEGLVAGDDVVELYVWTGACVPVDPAPIVECSGVDDIADISTDLTLVAGGFTCASPPVAMGVWNADCNDPCAPRTMTFYAIARNEESDCDGDGVFDFRPGIDVAIERYDVLVYPPQPITEVEMFEANACSLAPDVVTVELGYDVDASGTLEGNEICDTKLANAPDNSTCIANPELINVMWTAAEIEALTGAPASLACYVDVTDGETVNVFPNSAAFAVSEVTGDCGVGATVEITAVNGDVCFSDTGTAPVDPGCGRPDNVENLDYMFDPMFPAACNMIFAGSVAATCVGNLAIFEPAFTCPASVPLCNGAGVFNLMQVDNSGVATTGMFSGTGAAFVMGSQNPGGGATIDLTQLTIGVTYTLEYTVSSPGCPASTSITDCSFMVTNDCNANGGAFPSGN